MPEKLKAMTAVWIDLEKRYNAVIPQMYQLIMQYWNLQTGSWRRLVMMHEMLGERLAALGAPDASSPPADSDGDVKTLLDEIGETKALCRRLSTEFWALVPKANRVLDDLEELNKGLNAVVKEKSRAFKVSSSVGELKKLSTTVNNLYADTRDALLDDKLHKPDDPLIN